MKTRNLTAEQALAAAEVHDSNSRGIAKSRESEFDDHQSRLEAEIAADYRQLAELIALSSAMPVDKGADELAKSWEEAASERNKLAYESRTEGDIHSAIPLENAAAAYERCARELRALSPSAPAAAWAKRQIAAALEPLAALADAYDADLLSHGVKLPEVHEGDDSAVAFPVDSILPHVRKRPPFGNYLTMRDAVLARSVLRSLDPK